MADEEQQIAAQEGQEAQPDNEIESRARHMGWAPKEDFRGDPDKWVDADTFVKRGENIMPVLKERNRALEAKMGEMERVLVEMRDWASKSEQRSYERALNDLKAKQREAVAYGDVETHDRIAAQMDELVKEHQPPQRQQPQQTDPVFEQWKSENEWIDKDPELRSFAISVGNHLGVTKPWLNGRAFLDEAKRLVQQQYPEKFGNPKRNTVSAVESSAPPPPKRKEKTFSDLPADAKAQCQRFERTIPGFTKEQYLKDFDWSGYEKSQRN